MEKRFYLRLSIILIALMGLISVYLIESEGYSLRWNRSSSLPYTLFFTHKFNQISEGMYVIIDHPKYSSCIGKKIIGRAGDFIEVKNSHVFINGRVIGEARKQSTNGTALHPISSGLIPPGFVFAYAPHPDSFDSRYEEFGLINLDWIREKLCPLF